MRSGNTAMAIAAVVLLTGVTSGDDLINFDTQVIPVLTKAGCNVGACHGSAKGRGGFKLSLYGGDAAFDYVSIARAFEGRRVNTARPDLSLVIRKPTEELEHGGGLRFDSDSSACRILETWIRQGATRASGRSLIEFRVTPKTFVATEVGGQVRLRSEAEFSDGTSEDVSRWTVFEAEDPDAVVIDDDSLKVTLRRRGRHVVTARFLDRVSPLELILPYSGESVDLSGSPRWNYIDDYVLDTLNTLQLPVAAQVDDAAFARRLYLDLTGRLPTSSQIESFLGDSRREKRQILIDELLDSEEYVDFWTYRIGKLLRIKPNGKGAGRSSEGADKYYAWLRQQISKGTPYNIVVRDLLTSSGDSHEIGPANFYRTVAGARNQAEFTSELFMAVRMRCANCHNHPLDQWSQDDYHGLAAVFAKLDQGRIVRTTKRGQVTHPRTGEPAKAKIPGGDFIEANAESRQVLAEWLTDSDNPYFAKAIVNRLWRAMMGRGLVEPPDDMRQTNLPSHPKLLQRLADDFVLHGYDLRYSIRLIASSAAYQRSSSPVPGVREERYYSHALTRPLDAEVLADAISDVTGVWDRYGDKPSGTRAISFYDPAIPSKSLDVLGRCSREVSCESGQTSGTGGLQRKLHLLNGPLVNRKIASANGLLRKLLKERRSSDEILRELFNRALIRSPSEHETSVIQEELEHASNEHDRREILEDLLWSLLSSREFTHNQ